MLPNEQRSVTSSERFPCWITIEDISLTLCGGSSQEISSWDEIRVSFEREGITQHTRWITPVLTMAGTQLSSNGGGDGGPGDELNGTMEMRWSSVNTTAFVVYFRSEDATLDHSLDPRYERPTYSKNLQYLESTRSSTTVEATRRKVRPKTIRPLICSVECHKKSNIFSTSGGVEIEQRPTSAGVETVSAYYARSSSLFSALFKKTVMKLAPESTSAYSPEMFNVKDNSRQSNSLPRGRQSTNNTVVYATGKNSVDPSEAYNAPGGKHRISLELYPSNGHASTDNVSAPLTLHFTMVAHREREYVPPPRNYNSNVILLDQIVLDVTDANRNVTSKKGFFGRSPNSSTSSRKTVEAYGFGFTSNTSRKNDLQHNSSFIASSPLEDKVGPKVIDFASLHPSRNEREPTRAELAKNPTSVCIISSECDVGANRHQIGNRVVSVSRFKTARDGLCKPSYKCQLVLGLMRRYSNGEVEIEKCEHPIDLSSIINREYYPDKIRQITFSRGEVMNFRLRRRCFSDAEYHCSKLLGPYDYDNSGRGESGLGAADPERSLSPKKESTPTENCLRANDHDTAIMNDVKERDSISTSSSAVVNVTKSFFSYNNYEDGSYHSEIKTAQVTHLTSPTEGTKVALANRSKQSINTRTNGRKET